MRTEHPRACGEDTRRYALSKGTGLRIDHVPGGTGPLLWVADIVAGACRAEQLGCVGYREARGDTVLDFKVKYPLLSGGDL
ncbi:hypothetical protein [Streptomyces tremellae]|uniref:Uncharacterized protein n=1 Tax=Streptomyces tremellae TaxID=1124239 RepID=A0ABP7FS25_9ACTN